MGTLGFFPALNNSGCTADVNFFQAVATWLGNLRYLDATAFGPT